MNHEITIHKKERTDIRQFKNQDAVVQHLTLKGKGKLNSCLMTFSNTGDGPFGQRDLLFLKPMQQKANKLLPHLKNLNISQYDFCNIQIYTGNMLDEDVVTLHLSSGPTG